MLFRKASFILVVEATAFILSIAVLEVNGLKCIQCKGNYNLGDDCYNGRAEAVECPNLNHSYCISYSGHLGGTNNFLIIRNCSTTYVEIPCQGYLVSNFTGNHLHVCSKSCSTNGCNKDILSPSSGAASTKSSTILSLMMTLVCSIIIFGSHLGIIRVLTGL